MSGLRDCSQTRALIGDSHFNQIRNQWEDQGKEIGGFDWFTFSNWKSPPISVQQQYKITERLNLQETISISHFIIYLLYFPSQNPGAILGTV